ncbi:hypothetical protein [Enemella dayhoffiae]|uniref:hypothetical protein n=1 Tax=Enemella dayhoffiae TaxID=2016507 RepID=UPI00113FDC76|nr:hypothetical protein [Enemella dayhoffiae]
MSSGPNWPGAGAQPPEDPYAQSGGNGPDGLGRPPSGQAGQSFPLYQPESDHWGGPPQQPAPDQWQQQAAPQWQQPQQAAPQWQNRGAPPQANPYLGGPGPYSPGPPPPRPRNRSTGVIVGVALAATTLLLVVGVLVWFLSGPVKTAPAPAPAPTATSTSRAPSTAAPTGGRPTLVSAPPGAPASGALKDHLDKTYGTFPTARHQGNANQEIALPAGAARGILWFKTSAHWVSIEAVTEDGRDTPLVYSGDGIEGTFAYGVDPDDKKILKLKVETRGGTWQLELRPMSSAPVMGEQASGIGHQVIVSDGPARRARFSQLGTSNFIVQQYFPNDWDLLVNEQDDVEKVEEIGAGPSVIQVESWDMGRWSIVPA